MHNLFYYFKIWIRLTASSFQNAFVSRLGAGLFIAAKLIRFGFFFLIIAVIAGKTNRFVGYTLDQAIIFYLTFNFVDTATQLLFRNVYRFRSQIVNGDFDLTLIKPVAPLFQALLGGADPLDLTVLVPYGVLLIYFLSKEPIFITNIIFYLVMLLNGFVIAGAFHIAVLALAILTTEIDHAIMIYRDITNMGRFPVDIYREPLRSFITFIIPVGVMMTFPAKAFFQLLPPLQFMAALVLGCLFLAISLVLWRWALRQYTSASS